MVQAKLFIPINVRDFEAELNDWLAKEEVRIVDVKVEAYAVKGESRFLFVVLYDGDRKAPASQARPPSQSTVPTIVGYAEYDGSKRQAECMAGVFGVPEGWRLSPEDGAPAPRTLLSPDCDLAPYAELFGNIGACRE